MVMRGTFAARQVSRAEFCNLTSCGIISRFTGGCQKKRALMKIVIVSIIIKLWRDGSLKGVAIYSVLKIVAA